MTNDTSTAPVACSLGRDDLATRSLRWQALHSRAAGELTDTESGLRLSFRADPGVAEEVEALAALERDCCAFADWSVRAHSGRIVLEASAARDEAIAALHAMFRAF